MPTTRQIDKRYRELAQYGRTIADAMGMRDWTTTFLSESPTDAEHGLTASDGLVIQADSIVPPGRALAIIRLSGNLWWTEDLDHLREVICHELLHCRLWPYNRIVDTVRGTLAQQTYDVWNEARRHAEEEVVNALAAGWCVTLPLALPPSPSAASPGGGSGTRVL